MRHARRGGQIRTPMLWFYSKQKKKDQTVDRWRAVLNTTLNCTGRHFCVSFNEQTFWENINIEGS